MTAGRVDNGASRLKSAAMNTIPVTAFFPVFLFALPTIAWYLAVLLLLYRILQELKRIRAS